MLLGWIFAPLALLACVSCSAKGPAPPPPVQENSASFSALIACALEQSDVFVHLRPVHLSVLHSFAQEQEGCRPLFEYICQKYKVPTDIETPDIAFFTTSLLYDAFKGFTKDHRESAQSIFEAVITPSLDSKDSAIHKGKPVSKDAGYLAGPLLSAGPFQSVISFSYKNGATLKLLSFWYPRTPFRLVSKIQG